MKPEAFFHKPKNTIHRQYEALRAYFVEGLSAEQAAQRYGYKLSAFYSLARDFRKLIAEPSPAEHFFRTTKRGRKETDTSGQLHRLIVSLRKKYLSVPDIKAICDSRGQGVSEKYIYNLLQKEGFARLPRRSRQEAQHGVSRVRLEAPVAQPLDFTPESFSAQNSLAVLCLLPYLQRYGVDKLIANSSYPETGALDRLSSILSFLALKLSNIRRYSADDIWCMDRGLGMFAGLNVLPKAAWLTSYSSRVTRRSNLELLQGLHKIWSEAGLLGDTANLDFTTIPYWGDDAHLENNWSGTRRKALASMLALLGQDADSGIITYGDTTVRHEHKSQIVLEFLDFHRAGGGKDLHYLVFDSQFTTYEHLARLDGAHVKFLTIRRRGKNIQKELERLPAKDWKKVRVPAGDGKGRTIRVADSRITLRDYGEDKKIRQIAITGHGKLKPALIITNEMDLPCEQVVRKYARRWLVEKGISEQIEFFHLNRHSSGMVIKVDFDLTMSILAHNLLRVFALDLPGYETQTSQTLYNRFLCNGGSVEIESDRVVVKLKKKRHLPAILDAMEDRQGAPISVWGGRRIVVEGDTRS